MKALICFWHLWLWALLVCFWCITMVCVDTAISIYTMACLLVVWILFLNTVSKYTRALSSRHVKWPSSWQLWIIACLSLGLWNISTPQSIAYGCSITAAIVSLATGFLTLIKHCTAFKLQIRHRILYISMFVLLITNMVLHLSNGWPSSRIVLSISSTLTLPFFCAFANVKKGHIQLVSHVSIVCAGLVAGYPVTCCKTHLCTTISSGLSVSYIYFGITGIINTLRRRWMSSQRGILTFLLLQGGAIITQTLTTELLALHMLHNVTMDTSPTDTSKGHKTLLLVCFIFLWCLYVWQSVNKASLVTGILHLIAAWSHGGGCIHLVMLLTGAVKTGILTLLICISILLSTLQGLLVCYLYKKTKVVAVNSLQCRRQRICTRGQNLTHVDHHIGNDVTHPPPLPPVFRQPVRLSSHVTNRGHRSDEPNDMELQEMNGGHHSVVGYASILVLDAQESREPSPQPDQSGLSFLRVGSGSVFSIDTAPVSTQPTDDLYEEVLFSRN
uniref:K15 n=1 Tax=Human herpesvirus 8 TaxID=37296 RepID=A0A0N9RM37_HHV8|nr:K15 [Human gammaherpesvirus 8]ALH45464.1 K15 [Human gammaherpesvirus 8]USL94519.1 K15 [Human gammaherpesvirus 8]USL94520.1 K15 [Human gammaherpesvirus 8]USL94521.1 K15 [Human gammaherpesvirus 8]